MFGAVKNTSVRDHATICSIFDDTVVCKLDGKGYFRLETRVFIKISTNPC